MSEKMLRNQRNNEFLVLIRQTLLGFVMNVSYKAYVIKFKTTMHKMKGNPQYIHSDMSRPTLTILLCATKYLMSFIS